MVFKVPSFHQGKALYSLMTILNVLPMSNSNPLQREYDFYLKIKPDLLKMHGGKFALIKDEKLVGTFDTDQDAYKIGLDKFGNVPFLIIRIQDKDESAWIPVLSMGLVNASL